MNGTLDDRHKEKQVWALSNELGEEGWEMVSSFANYRTPQHSPATLWTLVFNEEAITTYCVDPTDKAHRRIGEKIRNRVYLAAIM